MEFLLVFFFGVISLLSVPRLLTLGHGTKQSRLLALAVKSKVMTEEHHV